MASRSLKLTKKYGTPNRRQKMTPWAIAGLVLGVVSIIIYSGLETPTGVLHPSEPIKPVIESPVASQVVSSHHGTTTTAFVTAYIDHGKMANGKFTHDGAAACSRKWKLGMKFVLDGKTYTCEDRYNERLETLRSLPTVDLWMDVSYYEAKKMGVEIKEIYIK